MGATRKGKKAWRHIDTTAVEDDHAARAAAAKSGAHVATLPDNALFFVDTKPSARAWLRNPKPSPAAADNAVVAPLLFAQLPRS
jgi:Nop53 (60S ribosomal biogenesis)